MNRYLKLRMKSEGVIGGLQGKTIYLEVIKETPTFYIGHRVTKEGDAIGCTLEVDEKHLIAKDAVKWAKPQWFSKKYGWLVDENEWDAK